MSDQMYMQRCFDLARLGAGRTSPNPMVGAVIVHRERIIGEGLHQAYGQAHAEVNAVRSVQPEDRHLLPESTLYVSLEPCDIQGNTPPCTLLVLQERIPKVVVACLDRTPGVDGSGLDRLRQAGVEVELGLLQAQGERLSQVRNTFVVEHRPYVLLKYAQSANGLFAPPANEQLWLSNAFSKRLVHRWRSECDAIFVGANTALADDPQLSNRLYFGGSPLRLTYDRDGSLPPSLRLLSDGRPTLVFAHEQPVWLEQPGVTANWQPLPAEQPIVPAILHALAQRRISSLMVEGGLATLQAFIDSGLWDEARVLTGNRYLNAGRPAPLLPVKPVFTCPLGSDQLTQYFKDPTPAYRSSFR